MLESFDLCRPAFEKSETKSGECMLHDCALFFCSRKSTPTASQSKTTIPDLESNFFLSISRFADRCSPRFNWLILHAQPSCLFYHFHQKTARTTSQMLLIRLTFTRPTEFLTCSFFTLYTVPRVHSLLFMVSNWSRHLRMMISTPTFMTHRNKFFVWEYSSSELFGSSLLAQQFLFQQRHQHGASEDRS